MLRVYMLLQFINETLECGYLGRVMLPLWLQDLTSTRCAGTHSFLPVLQPVLCLAIKESCRQPWATSCADSSRSTLQHHVAVWLCCRPRPGWEQLRHYLSGLADLDACGQRKDRWAGPCMWPCSSSGPTSSFKIIIFP